MLGDLLILLPMILALPLGVGVAMTICEKGTKRKIGGLITICCILGYTSLIVVYTTYDAPDNRVVTEAIDVWHTDAPYGTYWVETSGRGSFIAYRMWSELRESYTIKYLASNEVKTLHFTTDEIKVFLIEDNTTMTLIHKQIYLYWFDEEFLDEETWELYVPNPDLYKE